MKTKTKIKKDLNAEIKGLKEELDNVRKTLERTLSKKKTAIKKLEIKLNSSEKQLRESMTEMWMRGKELIKIRQMIQSQPIQMTGDMYAHVKTLIEEFFDRNGAITPDVYDQLKRIMETKMLADKKHSGDVANSD